MGDSYATTRRSLHGLAELVLAGPRLRAGGLIRLRVRADGITTWDEPQVRLSGGRLVSGAVEVPLDGLTFAEAAARIGLEASRLDDVYHDGPGVAPDEVITLVGDEVLVLEEALLRGDRALRAFSESEEPILWPEHFDVGITVDQVNYGVSPGDGYLERPYAYVGPHRSRDSLEGEFWNAPFGAARLLDELTDVAAVAGFFREGAGLAKS